MSFGFGGFHMVETLRGMVVAFLARQPHSLTTRWEAELDNRRIHSNLQTLQTERLAMWRDLLTQG